MFTDPVQMAISTFNPVSFTCPNVTPIQEQYRLNLYETVSLCQNISLLNSIPPIFTHIERESESESESERERESKSNMNWVIQKVRVWRLRSKCRLERIDGCCISGVDWQWVPDRWVWTRECIVTFHLASAEWELWEAGVGTRVKWSRRGVQL